ncbi:MAG: NEL-type E3 ubiquitin ligase domain-containing protein [Pseudomonadota bacterium]
MPTRISDTPLSSGYVSESATDYVNQPTIELQALAGGIAATRASVRTRSENSVLAYLQMPSASSPRRGSTLEQAFQFDTVPFDVVLQRWVCSGPTAEQHSRQRASALLLEAAKTEQSNLNLTGLKLSSLPDVLSSLGSVTSLDLVGNRLTTLPNLPPYLQKLSATGNRLTSLPELPETLNSLACDFNRLSALPDLPGSLDSLYVVGNRLLTLPRLPQALAAMDVSHNQLEHLPTIPNSIKTLSVRNNRLTRVPQLEGQIDVLELGYNRLQRLPENIERVVGSGILDVTGNQWDAETARRLSNMPPTMFVSSAGAIPRPQNDMELIEPQHAYSAHASSLFAGRFAPKRLFEKELARWLNGVSTASRSSSTSAGEDANRQEAANRIVSAYKNQSRALQLSGLNLKSLPNCLSQLKNLEYLYVDNNCLTRLPALPKNLRVLQADHNQLATLPRLPAGLNILFLIGNQLRSLPQLPENLSNIWVSQNFLTSLPPLPDSLIELEVHGNRLSRLPALPPNLEQLSAGYNQLTELPALPPTLESMLVAHNLLQTLPPLPASLFEVDASDNRLERLPALFGSHIQTGMLFVSDNPLPAHEIQRLRTLPDSIVTGVLPQPTSTTQSITQPRDRHPDAQTLRDALQRWQSDALLNEPARAQRWDAIARENYALVFGNLLDRLANTAEYYCPPYRPVLEARVATLLQALEADPSLRKLCFGIAEGESGSCGDRAALALNDMELARIGHEAQQGTRSASSVFATGLKMFRLSEVEKIANEKIQALKKAGTTFDGIEVRFGFHTLLLDRLQLPSLSREMLSVEYTQISESELAAAEARVRDLSIGDALITFMSNWEPWQKALERKHPDAFKQLQEGVDANRAMLDPKPEHLSEQDWIEAFAEQACIEVEDRADLTARLTEEFLQSYRVS